MTDARSDEADPWHLRRIVVVGTSGSGKTTLAARIACRLGVPHVELDALHWGPNWEPARLDVFRERTAHALHGRTWVVDGNYSKVRDIVWQRADTIVWLDYSLPRIMWQLLWRTSRRSLRREELWSGNRETLRKALPSRDSILRWALRTYRRRRREYAAFMVRPQYAHLEWVHLCSPRVARTWLATLDPADTTR